MRYPPHHQTVPSALTAVEWLCPAVMETTFVRVPARTGSEEGTRLPPVPNCPLRFLPQFHTLPSSARATV